MPVYRVAYHKGGEIRFISHLDLVRTLERAIRRAGLKMAFSQGFNPHPRLSFGPALAVGTISEREFFDLELTEALPPTEVHTRLTAQLPSGLDILEVGEISAQAPSLNQRINCATYRVRTVFTEEFPVDRLVRSLDRIMASSEVLIRRVTPKGNKEKNIRPGIYDLRGRLEGHEVVLEMALQTGSEGSVRPEDVVQGLISYCGFPVNPVHLDIRRTGLFNRDGGNLEEPMTVVKS